MTTQPMAGNLHVTGRVLGPDDPDYARLATPWNVAVPATPLAVVEVADAADVAATVRHAAAHGLTVAVQATGHGATAQGRPYLLVHTGRLDEVTIRPDGSARVGAGVTWERVLEAAAPHGLAGLAGSAPHVGVVGYLTGGCHGPVARTYGAASDRVTAFEVVTGDGEIRRATADENPALFWGLRGGKGTLGIVTAVEFELVPLAELYGGCVYVDGADAAAVAHAWAAWTADLPEQATSSLAFLRLPPMPGIPEPLAGRLTVAIRFAWVGDPAEGEKLVAGLPGTVLLGGMGVMPYAAIGAIHADPVDPMPVHEVGGLLRGLPTEAVDALLAVAGPEADCPQVIVEVRHLGGALSRRPAHPSALGHRDAAYNVHTVGIGVPPLVDAVAAHGVALLGAMRPWATGGCLPNFGASTEAAELRRRYEPDTLARLATLATTYDPDGVVAAAAPVHAACLV